MKRRNFLIKTTLATAGIVGFFGIPNLIQDTVVYSERELIKKELFSVDLNFLEKILMIDNLLIKENSGYLTNLDEEVKRVSKIETKLNKVEEGISEFVEKKVTLFRKKNASKEELYQVRDELNERYQEILNIKKNEKVSFINFKRNLFVSYKNDFFEKGGPILKELHRLDNYFSKLNSLMSNEKKDSPIYSTGITLMNLSADASFIRKASNISGTPIEEIVALANVESLGKKFAVGTEGEINRFQLHPKYLRDNYRNALSQKNILSDYIRENTSEKTLLKDLAGDSKLNIAITANLMRYLNEKTKTYYEYILSYNRGLGRALDIPERIRIKLENPENISEKSKRYSIYRYYTNFLDAKKAFEQIKGYVTKAA
ncbi:MAG: transglycosylase SLT domain-containing protein [Nanoarchaeota archaeon]